MSGYTQGYSHIGSTVVVADTGAFITGAVRNIYTPIFTVPKVLDEVKDAESKRILDELLATGRLHVEQPSGRYLSIARRIAAKGLSTTDIEVLAIALELRDKGYVVVIATDDYALQDSASRALIRVMRIRYRGARRGM